MLIDGDPTVSLMGCCWQKKIFNQRLASTIKQKFDISDFMSRLLSMKVDSADEVFDYLYPKIKNWLPNPLDLLDVDLAVKKVIDSIKLNKKITIFADYDVDGATSSAILKLFFRMINIEVDVYVPDRILEGYGPNSEALINLKNQGTDLVITVDCGTVAFKPLEDANKAGLDIIVIDHHLGTYEKPLAIAVINPNRIDEDFPHKNICAATVCFLFVVALNKSLREIDFYKNNKIIEPNIFCLLDLVALGTVCDVMPLTGLNRALVSCGLKIMQKKQNLGIKTIIDMVNLNEDISSYHLGFIIGPRINAGGRLGGSHLGSELLSTNDENKAFEIACQLEEFNIKRKDVEKLVLDEAIENLESGKDGFNIKDPVIFAVGKDWHQGVIGIVASRLKEMYKKPVAVIAIDSVLNKAKASCRSINEIDFGIEIINAKALGILIDGGGHKMAGGFSIKPEKIKIFHQLICNNLQEKINIILSRDIQEFDLEVDAMEIDQHFVEELMMLEPFGSGNYKPKLRIKNLVKIKSNLIGKKSEHISCNFANSSNIGLHNYIQAVCFGMANNEIGNFLLNTKYRQNFDVIGSVGINNWMGLQKLQIIIEDIILNN